jgi:hypothetical protein
MKLGGNRDSHLFPIPFLAAALLHGRPTANARSRRPAGPPQRRGGAICRVGGWRAVERGPELRLSEGQCREGAGSVRLRVGWPDKYRSATPLSASESLVTGVLARSGCAPRAQVPLQDGRADLV